MESETNKQENAKSLVFLPQYKYVWTRERREDVIRFSTIFQKNCFLILNTTLNRKKMGKMHHSPTVDRYIKRFLTLVEAGS